MSTAEVVNWEEIKTYRTEVGVTISGDRYRFTHNKEGKLLMVEWWSEEGRYDSSYKRIDFRPFSGTVFS